MPFWLVMDPILAGGRPTEMVPHWHHTRAACRLDAAAHGLPPGSCVKSGGALPAPVIDLDSDGEWNGRDAGTR